MAAAGLLVAPMTEHESSVEFPAGAATRGQPGNVYMPATIKLAGRVHECRFTRRGREFVADERWTQLITVAGAYGPPRRYRAASIAALQEQLRAEVRALGAVMLARRSRTWTWKEIRNGS